MTIMKEDGWVKFKVAESGGAVTAFQVGNGDDIDTDDVEEIGMGFAGMYAMKSGKVDVNALASKAMAQALVSKNLQILKAASMSVRVYAIENDGIYPEDLKELGSMARPTDPETGEQADPVYFEGRTDESNGKLPLLACPFVNPDGTRSVLFVDGSAQNIPDEDYQALISKEG